MSELLLPPPRAVASYGPIIAGTVTAPDLARSIEAYRTSFGYHILAEGTISFDLALSIDAPATAGRRWALLGCRDDRHGLVRIVASPWSDSVQPLQHVGWSALEIAVQQTDDLIGAIDASAFRIIGQPAVLGSTGGALQALQVVGPGNEVLYLTQQLRTLDGFDLPVPSEPVDRVFVAVLASHRLELVRQFLQTVCGGRQVSDHPIPIGVLNRSYGLPPDTTHRLSSVQLAGQSLIELDEHPPTAKLIDIPPGELTPGVALVTLAVPPGTEQTVERTWRHAEPPYDGNASWLVRLPTGERLELIAAS